MLTTKTAKGRGLYERSKYDYGHQLNMVYGRYSDAKRKAMDYCYYKFAKDENARHFRIISYNTFGFSAAWNTIYEIDGNVVPGVHIETPSNSYDVALM